MALVRQIQIGGGEGGGVPLGRQVQDSLNELAYKSEAASAQERAMLARNLWIGASLVEQGGRYLPQITVNTEEDPALLEVALRHLRAAGFGGDGWVILREPGRIALRGLTPFEGPQAGFIGLSGLVWEACERTSLPYGSPVTA